MTKTNSTTAIHPENSPYYDKTNKKVIGKFKDEAASTPVVEFVGLRSKMYGYIKNDEKGGKTAKGIKRILSKIISRMKTKLKNYIKHEETCY